MAEVENEIQEYNVEPDIDALKDDFDRCKRNLSYYLDRAEEAKEIRRDIWAGKTGSGQKDHALRSLGHTVPTFRPARRSNYRPRYCTPEVSSKQV